MDPPLCSLFRSADEPMCPGLPGDPSGPEALEWLALCWLLIWATVFLVCYLRARFRGPSSQRLQSIRRTAVFGAGFSLSVLLCCALNVRARNFGRWGELKQHLLVFAEDARRFEAEHGPINSENVRAFYELEAQKGRTRTFLFGARGPEVHIVFRHVGGHRPMIIWGHGGSAGFDLDTMYCDVSD
ncbi:MAG TPA: hypothetical protein VFX59_26455 [Polyangiales bacterium]|nr:hypothetical protein [Polyangiales bacterium]